MSRTQLIGSSSHIEVLESFNGKRGKFTKTFLINKDLNANLWGATNDAILNNLKAFIGLPVVEFFNKLGKRDHPTGETLEEARSIQETYRVGTIIAVGQDDSTENFWMIAEITKQSTFDAIQSGEIKFVSPSIWPKSISTDSFLNIQSDFIPLHNALVDDPAYGKGEAKVIGWCDGTTQKCLEELKPLVAGTIDSRIQHVQTVPLLEQNTSLTEESTQSKITLTDENKSEFEKLKQEFSALKAEVESFKKDTEDKKEKQTSGQKKGSEDDTSEKKEDKKLSATEEETKKKIEDLEAKNAAQEDEIKKPIVASILNASRNQGATEDQIKAQKKQLSASTLTEVQGLDNVFFKPFIDSVPTEISTVLVPDISKLGEQLIASSSSQEDDTKLLEAIS